jgi:hypothetical protein
MCKSSSSQVCSLSTLNKNQRTEIINKKTAYACS